TDKLIEEQFGAIIIATGYQLVPKEIYGEYGYGRIPNVIDGLQFERMLSASGPTGGRLIRPSDGKIAKKVVFVQCVGSRDDSKGVPYCSKVCCMYTAKQAMLFKHKVRDGNAWIFYIDLRSAGKGYEEFVKRAVDKDRVMYLRGRVSRIFERNGVVVVKGVDTLSGEQIEIRADLVVLATGITSSDGAKELAKKIGVSTDEYGFFLEAHPKLRPVECLTPGVFIAGACQAPKDIPDAVSQATAAAGKAMVLLSSSELVKEPYVAWVNQTLCSGCFVCESVCPYEAIERTSLEDPELGKREVAVVNPGKCEGCGACLPVCRSKALDLVGFSDEQILSEVNVLTERVKISKQVTS
ncbi:MAG: CoB--CoM heterodisulfide reductase iron-sulfur subunit A family protein, partial [bacterium]